jgi:hypothetical protein
MRTAEPLMRAAIQAGVHYLDFAAELDSYRLAETLDAEAKAAASCCLPAVAAAWPCWDRWPATPQPACPDPRKISIALHVTGSMSRGSAISASENLTTETFARIDGRLKAANPPRPARSISAWARWIASR